MFNLQDCISGAACILCARIYAEPAHLRQHLIVEHACRENITLLLQMGYAAVRPPLHINNSDKPVHQSTPKTSSPHLPASSNNDLNNLQQHLDESYIQLARCESSFTSSSTTDLAVSCSPDSSCHSNRKDGSSCSSSVNSSGYTSGSSDELAEENPPLSYLIDNYVDNLVADSTPPAIADPQHFTAVPVFDIWSPIERPCGINKYPVPEDLQAAIIAANPRHRIQFVTSQRMNLQMILDGYLLNKKKGPRSTRQGRTINWRCVVAACRYTVTSHEGHLVGGKAAAKHNHPAQPELYRHKL